MKLKERNPCQQWPWYQFVLFVNFSQSASSHVGPSSTLHIGPAFWFPLALLESAESRGVKEFIDHRNRGEPTVSGRHSGGEVTASGQRLSKVIMDQGELIHSFQSPAMKAQWNI